MELSLLIDLEARAMFGVARQNVKRRPCIKIAFSVFLWTNFIGLATDGLHVAFVMNVIWKLLHALPASCDMLRMSRMSRYIEKSKSNTPPPP